MTGRHRDEELRLYDYAADVLAVCPSCGSCVHVRPHAGPDSAVAFRATCRRCAWTREETGRMSSWGGPHDPFLGLPLWLVTEVGGEVLWAFNADHLGALESYVAAELRERTPAQGRPMSMLDSLPAWLKAAQNRDAVLAGLRKLRDRLAMA